MHVCVKVHVRGGGVHTRVALSLLSFSCRAGSTTGLHLELDRCWGTCS